MIRYRCLKCGKVLANTRSSVVLRQDAWDWIIEDHNAKEHRDEEDEEDDDR